MYKNEQKGRAIGSTFRVVWAQPQVEHRGASLCEARIIFFHLHISVVWIGPRSTFALCTALLTAEYAERAQSGGRQYIAWLPGCDVVVVNKLGGVECVHLLLNHASCIKVVPAPTGFD